MKVLVFVIASMVVTLVLDSAFAQQSIPFTDWRAALDNDLSKVSCPREAHQAIFNILQAYERQARQPLVDAQGQRHLAPVEPPK